MKQELENLAQLSKTLKKRTFNKLVRVLLKDTQGNLKSVYSGSESIEKEDQVLEFGKYYRNKYNEMKICVTSSLVALKEDGTEVAAAPLHGIWQEIDKSEFKIDGSVKATDRI